MTKWRDLFTDRQLVALTTFSDLVAKPESVSADAVVASLPDDGVPVAGWWDWRDGICGGGGGVLGVCSWSKTGSYCNSGPWLNQARNEIR